MFRPFRLVPLFAVVLLLGACGGANTSTGSSSATATQVVVTGTSTSIAATASTVISGTAGTTGTSAPAGTPVVAGPGDAANGDKLFHSATLGKDNVPGCTTCHSTEADKNGVGPSLSDIATDAAGAFNEPEYKGATKDAASWLKEQIVNPNLDIREGFQPNVMPKNYGTELTDQQLNDLAAYLLTLK